MSRARPHGKTLQSGKFGMDGGDWVVLLAAPFVLLFLAYLVLRFTPIGNLAYFLWLVAGHETIHWLTHNPFGLLITGWMVIVLISKIKP
jgi:hypothetical protein